MPDTALLGGAPGQGWAALDRAMSRALPILCSYMVGGCQAVYDMSVSHSRTRVQFGVPVGRFQRVQDHIVRLVNHLDAARWTTGEALWKLDTGRPAEASVHLAKAVASERYLEACNAAHEVHAGIGSAQRVRPRGPHPDVAHALPLPGRSALAQAPDGRRARVVTRGRARRHRVTRTVSTGRTS